MKFSAARKTIYAGLTQFVVLPAVLCLYRFEEQEAPGSRSFFTEIIASISDIKFAKDGRYILSRDYMTLKVWFLYCIFQIILAMLHAI